MYTLILAIFYLLISVSTYAADTPSLSSSSSSSSKEEEVIQKNNLLALRYPTGNDVRTYHLDLDGTEPISFSSYRDLLDEEKEKGMISVFGLYIRLVKGKEYSQVYDWKTFKEWLALHKTDPLTREPINFNNLHFFLVPNRETQYKPTYLFPGDAAGINIKPLNETLDFFNKDRQQTEPELTKAAFYAMITRKYTQSHPRLALKFAKFGFEGIQIKAEGLLATYRNFFIRTAGDISKQEGDIATAITHYQRGIELNDSYSISTLSNLCIQLGGDYIPQHIELLEKKAATEADTSILQHIYTHIISLYQTIDNQEAASATRAKIIDLDNAIKKPLKRERANSPTGDQNSLQVTPKRARLSTPN